MTDFDIPDEMKKIYIERRKKDLADCLQAVEDYNFEPLARISHQLKGNAASFGFNELSQIALDLEQAIHEKDLSKIKINLKKFEIFINKQ